MKRHLQKLVTVVGLCVGFGVNAATITLFDQDFESPDGFINNFGSGYSDLSQQQVNDLYGNQPVGFTFAQSFTVETIFVTGSQAFGTGYNDVSGQAGNYALGMLGQTQNDLLGLSFNVGAFDFFNFRIDISSVGLHGGPGAPFADENDVPIFQFTLFDNPTNTNGTGSGTILDSGTLSGLASPLQDLRWTTGTFAFDTSGSTNGNVTLQVDLIQGNYAAFDNFLITASDEAGIGFSSVSTPTTLGLIMLGFIGLSLRKKK